MDEMKAAMQDANPFGGEVEKAKIGILTLYYRNDNYGGQLQAYAMQRLVQRLNPDADVRLISYVKEKSTSSVVARLRRIGFKNAAQIASRKILFRACCSLSASFDAGIARRAALFCEFADGIAHTPPMSAQEVAECNFDAVVVGSDQVWTLQAGRDTFLLRDARAKAKVSYAASMGGLKPKPEDRLLLVECLASFGGVSTREESSRRYLASILDQEVFLVLDPTMLLSRDEWMVVARPNVQVERPYLFAYVIGEKTPYMKAIRDYAHSKGMQVVSIPHLQGKYRWPVEAYSDVAVYDAGPREWLSLLDGAAEVCTDSFHGTAFSINFGKRFAAIKKGGNDFNARDDRLATLMGTANLEDAILAPGTTAAEIGEAMNRSCMADRAALAEARGRSCVFLERHCAFGR